MSEAEAMWASMASSWFTPTILFCVMNLMIGIIFITSNRKSQNKLQQHGHEDNINSPQLVRAPSLIERVKSINFSLYNVKSYPLQPPDDQTPNQSHTTITTSTDQDFDHHVTRSKSTEAPENVLAKMKKSASEKLMTHAKLEDVDRRRPATVREKKGKGRETASFGEDEEVDAKADDFINRFKQQLKMQRLDSILRYREILNRGSGGN